jgi:hypothetical protein
MKKLHLRLFSAFVTAFALLTGCAALDEKQRAWIFQPSDRTWSGGLAAAEGMDDIWIDYKAKKGALTGGDDYELCFTVRPSEVERLRHNLPPERWKYCCIGTLGETPGRINVTRGGSVIELTHTGYDHFSSG